MASTIELPPKSNGTRDTPKNLAGKLALVTGGARGIGEAIAEELAHRGAKVAILYSSPESRSAAHQVIHKLKTIFEPNYKPESEAASNSVEDTRFAAVQGDLTDSTTPFTVINDLMLKFGNELEIDILINNAGVNGEPQSLADLTVENWERVMGTNLTGTVFLTQAIIRYLPLHGGRIVNIGSTAARNAHANIGPYSASKLALEALTRCWAIELGPKNVTVNCLAPGSTETSMLEGANSEMLQSEIRQTPAGQRLGTPDDIAKVVGWLCSPESEWITGQVICASGGYRMY